jgi:hypothetical protein
MYMKSIFSFASILIITLFFSSCDKSTTAPAPLNSVTFPDLNADYAPLVLNPAGPPTRPAEKKKYTFFSFKTGALVTSADSATNKWDIGFRATSIIFNSGTSGPGTAQGQVITGIFSELVTAPESGYQSDNKSTNSFVVSSSPFTPGASSTNNWWQNSGSGSSTIVAPIAGKIILVKTNDGRYAKMEILSYYKNAPAAPNNLTDLDRHYTFRYVYQPAASTSLK